MAKRGRRDRPLVVLGYKGHSRIAQFLIGTTAQKVNAYFKASVLIVKPTSETTPLAITGLRRPHALRLPLLWSAHRVASLEEEVAASADSIADSIGWPRGSPFQSGIGGGHD